MIEQRGTSSKKLEKEWREKERERMCSIRSIISGKVLALPWFMGSELYLRVGPTLRKEAQVSYPAEVNHWIGISRASNSTYFWLSVLLVPFVRSRAHRHTDTTTELDLQ